MICAGAAGAAAQVPATDDLRGAKLRQKRLVLLKAYERAWALACGLAARDPKVGQAALEGVRGVSYVKRRLDALTPTTKNIRSSSFNLLSNQVRYGGIGIYSGFLESCHLLTSSDLSLRPSGERLAAAFPPPPPEIAAHVHDEEALLACAALAAWGAEAHPGALKRSEGRWLAEALAGGGESERDDEVRWSMLRLLAVPGTATPVPSESELLKSVLASLAGGQGIAKTVPKECASQIGAVLTVVEPYERLYQAVLFLFQSLQGAATDEPEISLAQLATPAVVSAVAVAAKASHALLGALDRAADTHAESAKQIREAIRGSGVIDLADQLGAAKDSEAVLDTVFNRHDAVQGGKFDDGVRKASWLKRLPNHRLRLAAQRYCLGKRGRPGKWSDVTWHPYRTGPALSFIRACGDRIQ